MYFVFGVLGILFDSEKPIGFEIKTFIIIFCIDSDFTLLSGCILTKFKFDEIDLQKVQKNYI